MTHVGAGSHPGGIRKGNPLKCDILHHMIIVRTTYHYQLFQISRYNLCGIQILPGSGHIVQLIVCFIQIPLARCIQKLQSIFIIYRHTVNTCLSLISHRTPAGLIHYHLDLIALCTDRCHATSGIGPIFLEYKFQICRIFIIQKLCIATQISFSGNHGGIYQSTFTSCTCSSDIIYPKLSSLEGIRYTCHINILLTVICGKAGNL